MRIEELSTGQSIIGLEPSAVATIVAVVQVAEGAVTVVYKTPDGSLKERLLGRVDEESIAIATVGIRSLRLHDLRHGCASLLLAKGVSPRVVMETLGHSQISLTMSRYAHVMPALRREAAEKMDELLGDGG